MSSTRDFVYSTVSDAVLPFARQLLQDVVMEVLNERQVPTRTDYQELRNVVNGFRAKATSSAKAHKGLEQRLTELEARIEALQAENAALQAKIAASAPKRTRARKKTAS
jgi:septal ring factor EnvC (AmiA/AmiB activator)